MVEKRCLRRIKKNGSEKLVLLNGKSKTWNLHLSTRLFSIVSTCPLPDWNLFTGVPSCELHALTLGLFEHIVRAIFHGYEAVLRRSDLVHADGKPLVGDLRLKLHIHRLEHRLQELNPDESIFTFQPL